MANLVTEGEGEYAYEMYQLGLVDRSGSYTPLRYYYADQGQFTVFPEDLDPDSLVFFHNGKKKRKASHVGIYLKEGKIIHASSSQGVIVSALDEPYYRRCWMQGGRISD